MGSLWVLLLSSVVLAEQVGGKDSVEAKILQLENRRIQAMVKADTEELNQVLADDLTYTHSSGQVDSKSQLVESLKSGARKYQAIEPEDVKVRVYRDAAIVTGRARLKTVSKGQESNFQVRFTDIYANKGGRWQMVAWQSTRLPENQ